MNIDSVGVQQHKQHFVLSAGLKGVDSGVGCFPPLFLRQQSKKMQGWRVGRESKGKQLQPRGEPRKGDTRVVESLVWREAVITGEGKSGDMGSGL